MNVSINQTAKPAHPLTRPLFFALGFLFLGLAFVGFVLPMVPGLFFLMVSAGCFAKSSKRWHDWLLNSKMLGPMIRDWQDNRSISWTSKLVAIVGTIIFGGYSIYYMIDVAWLQWTAVFFMTTGIAIIASLKSRVPGR